MNIGKLVAGLFLGGSLVYGYACGSDDTNDEKYIWKVGNCETGGAFIGFDNLPENVDYVQEISPDELKCDGDYDYNTPDKIEAYNCALSKEPNLYIGKVGGKICLQDNLWLLTNDPYPGTEECRAEEWAKPWYQDCFEKNNLEP